ncbi:hypothetical protein BN1058_02716 [Paraliobacillus sp. PM-2]|uniref:hypothetical protein n=1 Tax=Paraliobacillus sp. PM-2 TaxID=1462524 RepID=UPI00061BE542|nr:hypothetical protein [Paraliobacillus sp. PM-2]CQR48348.1 hypothetical protein BN1058_02716 [Paraliobacillus sp. PM-2]
MLERILMLIVGIAIFFAFNWLLGYRKRSIVIDLDDRYVDWSDHVTAAKVELQKQGREVSYLGNGEFIIDGEYYMMINWNVSMARVPLQRTLFKYDRKKNKSKQMRRDVSE